jgi:sugar lactone lactonase YvrE
MKASAWGLLGVGLVAITVPAACGDAPEKTTAGPRRVVGAGGAGGGGSVTTTTGPVCGATCEHASSGAGTTDPFDVGAHESTGVAVDDDGALVISGVTIPAGKDLIWIASSAGGFVSKVDTTTMTELARYRTGDDPSRTSVDARGDVYVGDRGGEAVFKVAAAGEACPDTNGDGVVKTSTGPDDLRAAGQDDCVLWKRPLGHAIRGVAAQERAVGAGEEPRSDVWVGTLDGIVWKLDGRTGEVLLTTPSPCPVYGLAIDGAGQLWMPYSDCLGRVDTNACTDSSSCDALPVCTTSCPTWTGCDDSTKCDIAGKQQIYLPDMSYGITVDFKGRVWLGGGEGVKRYDPAGPKGKRWAFEAVGFSHGIAADAVGFVWAAADPAVVRVDAETLEHVFVDTKSSKGMAVDRAGKIWAISNVQTFASVIVPGPTLGDHEVIDHAVTGLDGPYTYSDMTGVQAALATGGSGRYVDRFTGCADGETAWIDLAWDASAPKGTNITFRVRTADNAAAIETATWVPVATLPGSDSPASVAGALAGAGIPSGKLLDVEITMTITASASSPKVKAISAGFACPQDVKPD